MGKLFVRVWFGVVKKLAVKVLLGKNFIEKYFRGILPQDGREIPINSTKVPKLGSGVDEEETII